MAAQEHVALARSLLDLYNNRQSDPARLDIRVWLLSQQTPIRLKRIGR